MNKDLVIDSFPRGKKYLKDPLSLADASFLLIQLSSFSGTHPQEGFKFLQILNNSALQAQLSISKRSKNKQASETGSK